MATYILGQRQPRALGLPPKPTSNPNQQPVAYPPGTNSYAIVSRGFAGRMAGYKHGVSSNGTLYGKFATYAAAKAYQSSNKMRLYTSIVAM